MNEEKFVRSEADALTGRIIDRLGERQQKLDRMAEWERKTPTRRLRPLFVTLAIAACVCAVFILSPFGKGSVSPWDEMGYGKPSLTEYRAASPEMAEIALLIEQDDFEAALNKTEEALKQSDNAIKEWNALEEMWDDESVAYEQELEWAANSELRWVYIYLLVQHGDHKKAKKEIKKYLQNPQYCEHETEAKALLEKL